MWWLYIVIAAFLLFGVYAFMRMAGFETRWLSRRTDRRAEDMYDEYADRGKRRRNQ